MAESQPTASTVNTVIDAPPTERLSLLDTLPGDLATDSYTRYLAAECDRARSALDHERKEHRATRDQLIETIGRGLDQAVKLDAANARITRTSFWAENAWVIYMTVVVSLMIIGTVIIPAVTR